MNGIVKKIFDPRPEPILQTEAAECGLACLAMVAAYHGYKTDLSLLILNEAFKLIGSFVDDGCDFVGGFQGFAL